MNGAAIELLAGQAIRRAEAGVAGGDPVEETTPGQCLTALGLSGDRAKVCGHHRANRRFLLGSADARGAAGAPCGWRAKSAADSYS
jgi:hypothetical protein